MKTKEIKALVSKGHSADFIYELAAGDLGLYGIAFFGHKGKPGDKQKLQRVWQRIFKTCEEAKVY
jgi:hypothetical protein